MNRAEGGGPVQETGQGPLEIAKKQFGVDLNDDHAVLERLIRLGGKMPDVMDLSNLYQDYQKQKPKSAAQEAEARVKSETMREQDALNENAFRVKVEKEIRDKIYDRLADLNDQLREKGMKPIPLEAVDKAVEWLEQMAVMAVKRTAKTFEEFDAKEWAEKLSQEEIDQALQPTPQKKAA